MACNCRCFFSNRANHFLTDPTSSTLGNIPGSTYNPPTSNTSSDPTKLQPSENTKVAGAESALSPLLATQGNSTRGVSGPSVPIRSSSNSKATGIGRSQMPEENAANSTSIPKRRSHSSIKAGSVASSKHSKKEAFHTPAVDDHGEGETRATAATAQKPKRRGGILTFLNCCSAPENANNVELGDQAVPAKKAKVLPTKPGRQPTPAVKVNTGTEDTGATEAKEYAAENIGGPEYSEMKPATKPKMLTRASSNGVPQEKQQPTNTSMQPPEIQHPPAPSATRDSPLPPIPATHDSPHPDQDTSPKTQLPKTAVTAAEPPQLVDPEESVALQGTTINDRTPQQEARDSDIAMNDAPPLVPSPDEQSNSTRDLAAAQMALPPPPPRNGQERSAQGTASGEKQQWLLPPLQPQLRGRKCLVLDLDETLVHSSFKVRAFIVFSRTELSVVDSSSSRLHNTCRD